MGMSVTKTRILNRGAGRAAAAHAARGLVLAIGMLIGSCLLIVVDSFVDGLADNLIGEET